MATEEAKAVGEVAKTAGKALEIVQGTGGWLSGVFGTLPDDLVGLVGADWVHEKRRRNIAQLQANTAEFIADLPPNRLTEPSPSVVLPLLQSAADESRPELQARWAALLANAITDGGHNVRRAFFETLAKMEPSEAAILDLLVSIPAPRGESTIEMDWIAEKVGLSLWDANLSMRALFGLNCATEGNRPYDDHDVQMRPPVYIATMYGTALTMACSPPRRAAT